MESEMTCGVRFAQAYEIKIGIDEHRSKVFGYFTSRSDGLEAAKGKGWYGGGGYSSNDPVDVIIINTPEGEMCFPLKRQITLCTSIEEHNTIEKQRLVKAALAKLTDEEKLALNLISE